MLSVFMLPWVYSLFHMMHLPAACDLQIPISVAPHGSLVCFHVFYHAFFYKIKLHVIPQVASCFFLRGWKQELFCSVEFPRFLRKFIFLSLLSVWQSLWFVKAILFLLSSAHEWILLTLFSPTLWHWQLQFAATKAKQGELIESGRDKWAAFDLPLFDPDWGSKTFQNLLFPNSRNQSFS